MPIQKIVANKLIKLYGITKFGEFVCMIGMVNI